MTQIVPSEQSFNHLCETSGRSRWSMRHLERTQHEQQVCSGSTHTRGVEKTECLACGAKGCLFPRHTSQVYEFYKADYEAFGYAPPSF